MPPPGAADAAVGGSGGSGDSERNVVEYARDKQCLCVRFEPGELDVPVRVLPHLPDGVESGGLRLLADHLDEQGAI